MIITVKLRSRNRSKVFDIVSCGPHADFHKNTKVIGFVDPIKHIYKIDDEQLKKLLEYGVKVNRNLYYILKHAKLCTYLEDKFIN